MNKEKYNQIIEEVYDNYRAKVKLSQIPTDLTKEEFVELCKNDITFSVYRGLKLEERELIWEERIELVNKSITATDGVNAALLWELSCQGKSKSKILNALNNSPRNIPTKLITITYNDKTIESYE
jgi:hypothetical protein